LRMKNSVIETPMQKDHILLSGHRGQYFFRLLSSGRPCCICNSRLARLDAARRCTGAVRFCRQDERKHGAERLICCGPRLSIVRFDDRAADGEPRSQTIRLGRIETIEDMIERSRCEFRTRRSIPSPGSRKRARSGLSRPNSGLPEFGILSGRSRIYPTSAGRGGNLLRRRFSDQITYPADHVGSAMGVLDDPVQRKRKYARAARPGAATP
jgi:hypothetical protein